MRAAFVHKATVALDPDSDIRGPGGAITLLVCGSWDHRPPCPLAAHHTHAERFGGTAVLRIVFAAEPEDEAEVRDRIDRALRTGAVTGPEGVQSHWKLLGSKAGTLTPPEAAQGLRIAEL